MRHGSADLIVRPRRLRRTEAVRRLVRETELSPADFILPMFVLPGTRTREPISSMPGISRVSADLAVREAEAAAKLGISGVILFGLPSKKDPSGSEGWSDRGAVQTAVRLMKKASLPLAVITDVCMCEYTSHGHCGILHDHEVDNDRTLPLLAKVAVSHARAGADLVAPSDMMDGRVAAIRSGLDRSGYSSVGILSYAAKYASAFYGPFRDAAGSVPSFGDRKGYQMDPPNAREALKEIALDLSEGADLVMVKPALSYLDVIRRAKDRFDVPVFAYNVSGEYAMVKAAGVKGWVDERRATLEVLTSIKRAGADRILTYHAVEAARWLRS